MDDANGLDGMIAVFGKACAYRSGVCADAPVGGNELGLEAEAFRHSLPKSCELPRFKHEHFIARGKRIRERGFPGAGTRRWIDYDRRRCLENCLDAVQNTAAKLLEFRTTVIDDRARGRMKNAIWNRCRSRDLQKMPSGDARCIRTHERDISTGGYLYPYDPFGMQYAKSAFHSNCLVERPRWP